MSSPGIDRAFERRLASLVNAREPRVLQGGLKGVEKESLRVSPDGYIEQSEHPRELGSTLTHEHITTDYSEALIELVTPAFKESWELLQYLCDLHQFVYRHLGEQLLWATSMPCIIDGDPSIPIARYGRSNIGKMKEVVSPRPRLALRPDDAGDLRRALQLFVPGAFLAGAGGYAAGEERRPGFRLGAVLRLAAQLPSLRLAGAVPVRQFAGVVRVVRQGARAQPAGVRARYAVRAVRDVAAHERSRLSEQEPGRCADLGQQSRRVRARFVGAQ